MKIDVVRFAHLPKATIGALSIDGAFQCFTLEDEHREVKVAGETRIPAGAYQVGLRTLGRLHERYAERLATHRGMLELLDVPGFEAVLIHIGNTERDTAGCILVGHGALASGELMQSTQAYASLYERALAALDRGEVITVEVRDL